MWRGHPVHCRMYSSITDPYTLDASSILSTPVRLTKTVSRHCLTSPGAKLPWLRTTALRLHMGMTEPGIWASESVAGCSQGPQGTANGQASGRSETMLELRLQHFLWNLLTLLCSIVYHLLFGLFAQYSSISLTHGFDSYILSLLLCSDSLFLTGFPIQFHNKKNPMGLSLPIWGFLHLASQRSWARFGCPWGRWDLLVSLGSMVWSHVT